MPDGSTIQTIVFRVNHGKWRLWSKPAFINGLINCLAEKPVWSFEKIAGEIHRQSGTHVLPTAIPYIVTRLIESRLIADHNLPEAAHSIDIPPDCREAVQIAAAKLPQEVVAIITPEMREAFLAASTSIPSESVKSLLTARQRDAIITYARSVWNQLPAETSVNARANEIARQLEISPATVKLAFRSLLPASTRTEPKKPAPPARHRSGPLRRQY